MYRMAPTLTVHYYNRGNVNIQPSEKGPLYLAKNLFSWCVKFALNIADRWHHRVVVFAAFVPHSRFQSVCAGTMFASDLKKRRFISEWDGCRGCGLHSSPLPFGMDGRYGCGASMGSEVVTTKWRRITLQYGLSLPTCFSSERLLETTLLPRCWTFTIVKTPSQGVFVAVETVYLQCFFWVLVLVFWNLQPAQCTEALHPCTDGKLSVLEVVTSVPLLSGFAGL